jgi:CRP-like cAMP-binding protein
MAWKNHFLDSLPPKDLDRLARHLDEVKIERNEMLGEAGKDVVFVYLPVDSILSVLTVMKDGAQVESRTIGCEGGYGLLQALGSAVSYERTVCQVAGRAWRAPLGALRTLADASRAVREAIVRHAQASLLQAAQSTACNTLHRAEQRLCRWLLLTQDRVGSDLVPLTQEHLAVMLGVQRTTVTAAASALQSRGVIAYTRGKIRILDRPALERCACECYEAIQRGAARMLAEGAPPPDAGSLPGPASPGRD